MFTFSKKSVRRHKSVPPADNFENELSSFQMEELIPLGHSSAIVIDTHSGSDNTEAVLQLQSICESRRGDTIMYEASQSYTDLFGAAADSDDVDYEPSTFQLPRSRQITRKSLLDDLNATESRENPDPESDDALLHFIEQWNPERLRQLVEVIKIIIWRKECVPVEEAPDVYEDNDNEVTQTLKEVAKRLREIASTPEFGDEIGDDHITQLM
jgi:hypothetical protein